MRTFNLSRWALEHKSFVVYLMLVVALAGLFEYRRLGRDEDPTFTIKTMVVKTLWPGATALETMQQVTDRIEKKLEELPNIDYQKSYTKPGESVLFIYLKDSTPASEVSDLWYQVRKKIGNPAAGGAVAPELPGRFHHAERAAGARSGHGARIVEVQHPPIVPSQPRLVVKGIDMARPTLHEDEDDAPGPRLMVRTMSTTSTTARAV